MTQKIKSDFGNGEERVGCLELLCTSIPPELEKWCCKLVKYTLPCVLYMSSKANITLGLRSESADTQLRAFKDIVDIVTLLRGLRALFRHAKYLQGATSTEAMSVLWNRSNGPPDDEWMFWQTFAATCLAEITISIILEESSVSLLTTCEAG
jgi:hypothetical protein